MRKHAGCDLIAKRRTFVYAIEDGYAHDVVVSRGTDVAMTRALLLTLAICGCEVRAEQSPHVVQPLSAAATVGDKSSRDSNTRDVAPAQVVVTDAPSTEASASTRKQHIELFVKPDVLTLTPDSATGRFASVYPIQREAETPDGFLLVARTPTEELNFDYVANAKGGFLCQQASLEYYVSTADESAALYREMELQLQAKLGKPKRYPSAPETPYWKLVRRVQATLSDHTSSRRTPNGRMVAIRIAEPAGP